MRSAFITDLPEFRRIWKMKKRWPTTRYFAPWNIQLWRLFTSEDCRVHTEKEKRKLWRSWGLNILRRGVGLVAGELKLHPMILRPVFQWVGLDSEGCCGRWGSLVCAFFVRHHCCNTLLLDAKRLSSQPFELCKLVRYCDVTKFFALLSSLP